MRTAASLYARSLYARAQAQHVRDAMHIHSWRWAWAWAWAYLDCAHAMLLYKPNMLHDHVSCQNDSQFFLLASLFDMRHTSTTRNPMHRPSPSRWYHRRRHTHDHEHSLVRCTQLYSSHSSTVYSTHSNLPLQRIFVCRAMVRNFTSLRPSLVSIAYCTAYTALCRSGCLRVSHVCAASCARRTTTVLSPHVRRVTGCVSVTV